jgi:asparagine synthase (glutamine-hydrolysing)
MGAAIAHRGPDSSGTWMDEEAGVGLVHRRLSILDLSPAGHQPMVSPSGRYVLVFNGEIYNHQDLRAELNCGMESWRGHSDTETLLASFEIWGMEATLKKTVGMFALALWDRAGRILTLARDRLGEKPLYYGWSGGTFLFGSELKALVAYPGFNREIDRGALALLLRHNYIPAPHSIYRGIKKLLPGTSARLRVASCRNIEWPEPLPYWSLRSIAEEGQSLPLEGSEDEAVDLLEEMLRDAVRRQMVADVPLGAFLSGGVDSSTVVALMQSQSSTPVRTFTIGFSEPAYNEAGHAREVAGYLGTDHTELYVTPKDALDVIPLLPHLYDEPFSDSSQIPTFLLSQLVREHVTVSLSGDGGDELFGGYNRYMLADSIWKGILRVPAFARGSLTKCMESIPPCVWNTVFGSLRKLVPYPLRISQPSDKLQKLTELLGCRTPEAVYHNLVSHWKHPGDIVLNGEEPSTVLTDSHLWAKLPVMDQRMMYLDSSSYLPDDILVKVDRAAMAVSLETRVPFLDHRIVELAWRMPLSLKIRDGRGKWILRQVLDRYVPRSLIERPKMGFGVPIDSWLRGPLRDWAESLLSEDKLAREGFFDPAPIREKWVEHLSGRRNFQYYLWDVLMFQQWHDHTFSRHDSTNHYALPGDVKGNNYPPVTVDQYTN